ncbi:MAG: hypothetical protein F6K14_06165 [Symploca sp. SIO2C1]|nr:hypothetical protein [Symploca sp. SIO2C1]
MSFTFSFNAWFRRCVFQLEQIKRVRIVRRADGYYVQFSVQLDPRDTAQPLTPSQKAVGVEDRDINAALNILQKGLSTVGHTESLKLRESDPLAGLEQSCSVKV